MAEMFYLGEKKARPGVYFRVESNDLAGTAGATNGVVAAVFNCNWGSDKVQTLTKDQLFELEDLYGSAADFLEEIFIGGARTIRAIRVSGTGGASAQVTLKSNADEPADLVKITARFVGNRNFTVSLRSNLITGRRQCIFYDGTVQFAIVEFESGGDEAQKLVDALARNAYFTGEKIAAGVLADVDQKAITGGVNPTITAANYSAALEALERYRWNCVVADSDDVAIRALLYNFVVLSYETGHFGIAVIAGKSSEDLDDRMHLAATMNDWRVVYVLNGWISNTGKTYEGYWAAARIAGMIAGSETNTSVAYLVISNAVELIEPLTNGQLISAVKHGCLALSLNDSDQIILDSAITTFITVQNNLDLGWSKIRRVRTRFELMERVNRTIEPLIARLNNDFNGRSTICAAGQGVVNEMIAEDKFYSGSKFIEDERFQPNADYAYFLAEVYDIDSLEKIYLNFRFSYNSASIETTD